MRTPITALSSAIVPADDCDRPDPDDESIQAIAREFGVSAKRIADFVEETTIATLAQTGKRPAVEDVLAALEAVLAEKVRA